MGVSYSYGEPKPNTTDTDLHLDVLDSSSITIKDNYFKGKVEVWSHDSQTRLSDVHITGNRWTPTDGYAGPTVDLLKIRRVDGGTITDNHITGLSQVAAITVQASTKIEVNANEITGSKSGIRIYGESNDIGMTSNTIKDVETGVEVLTNLAKDRNYTLRMYPGNTIDNATAYGVDVKEDTMMNGYNSSLIAATISSMPKNAQATHCWLMTMS